MKSAALSAAAQQTLDTWHRWLEQGNFDDVQALGALMADDVVFRSPVAHTPYPGRQAICLVLMTVNKVFQNFRYHRQFASEDGASVTLEFSTEVDGKAIKGVDLIRFDAHGKIVEFEVMVRPATGLQALAAAMGARLAAHKDTLTNGA